MKKISDDYYVIESDWLDVAGRIVEAAVRQTSKPARKRVRLLSKESLERKRAKLRGRAVNRQRELQKARKKQGLCVECGIESPLEKRVRCAGCLEKARSRTEKNRDLFSRRIRK